MPPAAAAAIPLAAKIGIGVGGALLAKKAGSSGPESNPAADMQAQIARELFQQTDPLRRALIGRSQDFVGGGFDVTQTPSYALLKNQVESQYGNARDNIVANTPGGGPLIAALTQNEGSRADALTLGTAGLYEDELNRALGLATGATGPAVGGLGQAASVQAMLAQSAAQRQAGLMGALGTGVGAYLGSK